MQRWYRNHLPSLASIALLLLTKSSDLNQLVYVTWDELAPKINWNRFITKTTLIEQLKREAKEIRQEVVFEICYSWTERLYRLSENDSGYLRQ